MFYFCLFPLTLHSVTPSKYYSKFLLWFFFWTFFYTGQNCLESFHKIHLEVTFESPLTLNLTTSQSTFPVCKDDRRPSQVWKKSVSLPTALETRITSKYTLANWEITAEKLGWESQWTGLGVCPGSYPQPQGLWSEEMQPLGTHRQPGRSKRQREWGPEAPSFSGATGRGWKKLSVP